MTGPEHYREAELLLESCQIAKFGQSEADQYPAREDGADSTGHALAAAQVHATLALAAATAITGQDRFSRVQAAWILATELETS